MNQALQVFSDKDKNYRVFKTEFKNKRMLIVIFKKILIKVHYYISQFYRLLILPEE